MSACYRHASKEAVGACINCGELVCAACHKEIEGKSYCQTCVDKLFAARAVTLSENTHPAVSPTAPAPISENKPPVVLPAARAPVSKKKEKAVATPVLQSTKRIESKASSVKQASDAAGMGTPWINWAWWIPPIVLGWIGGLISWLPNKASVPKTARNMLFTGIGMTVVHVIIIIALVAGSAPTPPERPPLITSTPTPPVPSASTAITTSSIPPSINTIVVGPDIPSAPEQPEFILKPLVTKTIESSDEDQIVAGDSNLTILIPGGTLKNTQELKISSVQNPPPLSDGFDYIAVYDITFNKDHDFDKNLTFCFAYGSSEPSHEPISDATIAAAYWNEGDGSWTDIPVRIDIQSSITKLNVQTSHNGRWAWIKRTLGFELSEEEEEEENALFIINWTPSELPQNQIDFTSQIKANRKARDDIRDQLDELNSKLTTSKVSDEERKVIEMRVSSLNKQFAQVSSDSLELTRQVAALSGLDLYHPQHPVEYYVGPPIASDLMDSLSLAYRTYKPDESDDSINNFRMPATPIHVSLSRSESHYSKISKWINIDITHNGDWATLRNTAAHELFHAVQNQYYYAAGQNLSRNWWLESTAEYAATKLVRQGFFIPEITAKEWMATPFYNFEDEHAKRNCYFLDWLITKYCLDFKAMFDYVTSSNITSSAFEKYLKKQTMCSMPELYRDFIEYLLFDKDSPDKNKPDCENRPIGRLDTLYEFSFKSELSSKYVGICPEVDEGERWFYVSVPWANWCKNDRVDIYTLKNNERSLSNLVKVGTLGGFGDDAFDPSVSVAVPVEKGDGLYLLVTQAGKPPAGEQHSDLKIRVQDMAIADLSIESNVPKDDHGNVCVEYTFTAKHSGMPPDTIFKWTIDDQQVNDNAETINHRFKDYGLPVVKVNAAWQIDKNPFSKEAKVTCNIGKPKLEIIPEPVSDPVINTPYEFLVKSYYIPDDATYIWSVDDSAESTSNVSLKTDFKTAKPHTIKVKASWAISGCTGNTETSLPFTVKNVDLSIVAEPSPGTAKEISSFKVEGYIPQNPRLSWDFGEKDQTGNLSNNSAGPVTHKYKDLGIYHVKVTLLNSEGKTVASADLDYMVNYEGSLSIEMTPKSPIYTDQDCSITAVPNNIQPGATYTWFIDDKQVYRGLDKNVATLKAGTLSPGSYNIMVIADRSDPLLDTLKATATLVVQGRSTIYIQVPGAGNALPPDKVNTFYAVPTNIPDDAVYEWYINEEAVLKAPGKDGMEAVAPPGFFNEGDYEILVIAKWKGADLQEQWAQADAEFKVSKINISLSIIPPPEIHSNNAKENTKYYFTFDTNIPSTATFTWYSDGQEAGKGQSIGLAFSSGQHIVELKANWQDTDAAKTKHEQKAEPFSFNIGVTQPLDDSGPGWYLVKIEPPMKFSEYYGPHKTQSFDNGKYTVTYPSWYKPDGDPEQWQTNNFVYTKMPQYLKPDSDFKISCSINATSSLYFAADNIIESRVQPGTGAVYYVGGKIIYRCEFEGSKTSALHIMPGVPGGDKLRIRVSFFSKDTMDASGGFTQTATYIYEYR